MNLSPENNKGKVVFIFNLNSFSLALPTFLIVKFIVISDHGENILLTIVLFCICLSSGTIDTIGKGLPAILTLTFTHWSTKTSNLSNLLI